MARRSYEPSYPEALLETAYESAKVIETISKDAISDLWSYLGWEEGKDASAPFEAQIVLVMRAKVVVDSHRSRVMETELIEAFTPLKAVIGKTDFQLWTDYRDQDSLELCKYFSKMYFEKASEEGESVPEAQSQRVQNDDDERVVKTEGDYAELNGEGEVEEESKYASNGVHLRSRTSLAVVVDPKTAAFAHKKLSSMDKSTASMLFQKGLVRKSHVSGSSEAQELLQNLVSAGVSVVVLMGIDLERAEPNEIINLSQKHLALMMARNLGFLPSSINHFPISRTRRFGNDFCFENAIAVAERPVLVENQLLFES